MAGYEYKALRNKEIRILQPLSQKGLSYQLKTVNLDAKPEYEALSYTWGAPVFPCVIQIDGCAFNITKNLNDALQQLSSNWGQNRTSSADKHLWIDAICINQRDISERSQQVRLMRRIYEQAGTVLVWLGKPEDEERNRLAVLKLQDFYGRYITAMKKNRPYRPFWWPNKPVMPTDDMFRFLASVPASDKTVYDAEGTATFRAWTGINSILKADWWKRTWVFQEATIPDELKFFFVRGGSYNPRKRRVSFLCGSSEMSWLELSLAISVALDLRGAVGPHAGIALEGITRYQSIKSLQEMRTKQRRTSLTELLQLFRHTLCKDPRDKVYAPLGLTSDGATERINPDYNKSPLTVYIDVVKYCLSNVGHELDFLGYTTKLTVPPRVSSDEISLADFPTWLPNWDQPVVIKPLAKVIHVPADPGGRSIAPYDRRAVTASRVETLIPAYKASGNSRLQAFLSGHHLHMQGFQCDVVKHIIMRPSRGDVSSQSDGQARAWAAAVRNRYITGESFDAAFSRTECADLKYDFRGSAYSRNGMVDFNILRKEAAELDSAEGISKKNMQIALNNAMLLRNVCLTERGYLGLVPRLAVVGDPICVFLGGQVFYCLRRVVSLEHGYEYIGESYLHGLMDGEVLGWLHDRRARVDNFVLV